MAPNGYYQNPSEKPCWDGCMSCFRCRERFRHAACKGCSGRLDPDGTRDAHPDDWCDCANGNLRWVTKEGRLIIRKYKSNPYAGRVVTDAEDEHDRDWNAYINEKREKLNNPRWDPITFNDGTSATDWQNAARGK